MTNFQQFNLNILTALCACILFFFLVSQRNYIGFLKNYLKDIKSILQKDVSYIENSCDLDSRFSIVLLDASTDQIEVTLPSAKEFNGSLSLICVDGTKGIKVVCKSGDRILGPLSIGFGSESKWGDCITIKSASDEKPEGFWFVVGKFST